MRRFSRLLGATAFALIAGPAVALSCLAPDVANTFIHLDEAPETYVVIHGTLTFDEGALPQTNWEDQAATPTDTPIPARMSGMSLTPDGFTASFERAMTFNPKCLGPWCASAVSGSEVMAFVEYRDGGYVFSLGPCYAKGFFEPDQATLDQAVACMRGESCTPAERQP